MPVKQWVAVKVGRWKEYPTEWTMYDPAEEQEIGDNKWPRQNNELETVTASERPDHSVLVGPGR